MSKTPIVYEYLKKRTDEFAELYAEAEYGEPDDENAAKRAEISLELDKFDKLTDAEMRELEGELLFAGDEEEEKEVVNNFLETHSPPDPGSGSRKKRQSKSRKQKKSRTRRQKKTQRKGRKQSNRK